MFQEQIPVIFWSWGKLKRTKNFGSKLQNTFLNRKLNHIALVLRLSNYELFTLQCSWIKKSPPSLIKLENYKDKKFSYAFSPIYFKKCLHKLDEKALHDFEKYIAEIISKKIFYNNFELILTCLKVLGIVGPDISASKFSIGQIIRRRVWKQRGLYRLLEW